MSLTATSIYDGSFTRIAGGPLEFTTYSTGPDCPDCPLDRWQGNVLIDPTSSNPGTSYQCLYADPHKWYRAESGVQDTCEPDYPLGPYLWQKSSVCPSILFYHDTLVAPGDLDWVGQDSLTTQEPWVWFRIPWLPPDFQQSDSLDLVLIFNSVGFTNHNTGEYFPPGCDHSYCGCQAYAVGRIFWSECHTPCTLPCTGCCDGPSRGNIDGSPDNLVTMSDLTLLIDHLFTTFEPLACVEEGNIDLSADGLVTMGDLTVMIDHLFIEQKPLPPCP